MLVRNYELNVRDISQIFIQNGEGGGEVRKECFEGGEDKGLKSLLYFVYCINLCNASCNVANSVPGVNLRVEYRTIGSVINCIFDTRH